MRFVDINTFFAPESGGIRTYHRAKIAWFEVHPEHEYFLVCPGPRYREHALAENVRVIEVRGPRLSRSPGGYRLMLDYLSVLRLLRRVRPDVVEAGDPWLTGISCLLMRRLALLRGLLASFYHSDPIHTWVVPNAAAPGLLRPLRRAIGRVFSGLFYGLQRSYPLTIVTSRSMVERLQAHGVQRVARLPFGTEPRFFSGECTERGAAGPVRLLYVGRLGKEKGIELLLAVLPELLARSDVRVTVVGRGAYAVEIAAIRHERFEYLGYVSDRDELAAIYRAHDVLLAPGEYETFGLCVLEALAAGLRVVGPDEGGTADLLGEMDSPFRFRAGDVESFHSAVLRAVAADALKEAERSRALARRYGSWDEAISRMVAYYEALCATSVPSAEVPVHAGV
jgi:alpha-1,6-mannosyltransferase